MYRVLLILSWIRKHQARLTTTASLAALAIVTVAALVVITDFRQDVREYETRLAALNAEMEKYETAARRNEILTADNTLLQLKNEALETENNDIAAANDELERRNGELSKKFDGLSKPN